MTLQEADRFSGGPASFQAARELGLAAILEAWVARLTAAGVNCRAAALHDEDPAGSKAFPSNEMQVNASWKDLLERISPKDPIVMGKVGVGNDSERLLAVTVRLPTGRVAVAGLVLTAPYSEKAVQVVLLSIPALEQALSVDAKMENIRASRLLDLLGHVNSQASARAAAQEWVNRTAAWLRSDTPDQASLSLMLFDVRGGSPRWWVAADTAWAERASPQVQSASEVAGRAVAELHEFTQATWWALPLLDEGKAVGVLVASVDKGTLPIETLTVLRASAALAEPLLRHWREAEYSVFRRALESARLNWTKLWGPGHLAWKFGALAFVVATAAVLLLPVPDRVGANAVIEGRVRQIVTAPFDGFIGSVLVRPGDRVKKGQVLAHLDDRDLKLEQGKYRSERDQSVAKHRLAMADRDAAAVALGAAEIRQAEAQLALVESKLVRAALLAPMDGIVVNGDWVQQIGGPVEIGKEMFEIIEIDTHRVVLHVPDDSIARVLGGQEVAVRLTAQPQRSFPFTVSVVTSVASVQDGINGFRVEAVFEGEAAHLSPGMQGVGKITVGKANLWTVWTRSSLNWLRLKFWSWWW